MDTVGTENPGIIPVMEKHDDFIIALGQAVQVGLRQWIQDNLNLTNIKEISETVFELLVTAALEIPGALAPPSETNQNTEQLFQKFELEWRENLNTFGKMVTSYNVRLGAVLDLYRHIHPPDLQQLAEETFDQVYHGLNTDFLLSMARLASKKITGLLQTRNQYVMEYSDKFNQKLELLVNTYRKDMESSPAAFSSKKTLLQKHSELKDKCIMRLHEDFPRTEKNILLGYELQLVGILNSEYDRFYLDSKLSFRKLHRTVKALRDCPTGDSVDQLGEKVTMKLEVAPVLHRKGGAKPMTEFKQNRGHNALGGEKESSSATRVGNTKLYYNDRKILSKGPSAIVYQGHFDNRPAAVKRFHLTDIEVFQNELLIWRKVDDSTAHSVNVVRLLTSEEWELDFYIATELAQMDLSQRINQLQQEREFSQDFSTQEWHSLVKYAQDMAKGLQWLHRRNIIHRDIKPANILIFQQIVDGRMEETAKVTDFGISRNIPDQSASGVNTEANGTDEWSAPEVLKAKTKREKQFRNSKSQDIFSLGLTIYYTLSLGKHPFGESKLHGSIIPCNILDTKVLPKLLPRPHYTANELICLMVQKSGNARPSIRTVLKHPLFWDARKSLEFLTEFAIIVGEKNDSDVRNFRNSVDKAYSQWHELMCSSSETSESFDWKKKLDTVKLEAIMQRRVQVHRKFIKSYNEDSVMSLLELIRDKNVHNTDLPEVLLKEEHFGKNGIFDRDKYATYFLETFPHLLLFLVQMVSNYEEKFSYLNQLKDTYF